MATTKFDICSSALALIGVGPISAFSAASTQEIVANALYQSTLDNELSIFPWRFATKTELLSRDATAPDTLWSASYTEPSGMKSIQALIRNDPGNDLPFDRQNGKILCDASSSDEVYAVYTYEPAVTRWPGYFVKVMELSLAVQFAIAIPGKLDFKESIEDTYARQMRVAHYADSRQQTTRKLRTTGRGSIIEARRS